MMLSFDSLKITSANAEKNATNGNTTVDNKCYSFLTSSFAFAKCCISSFNPVPSFAEQECSEYCFNDCTGFDLEFIQADKPYIFNTPTSPR